ncbi:MAG: hypothetical protein WBE92_05115, partial [Steroidobacteraceae bacterium]
MYDVRRLAAIAAGAAAAVLCILPAGAGTPKRAATEAQLEAVQAEIARIHKRESRGQVEVNRMTRDLKGAELAVGAARGALDQLQGERTQRAERRAQLAAQKRQREAE